MPVNANSRLPWENGRDFLGAEAAVYRKIRAVCGDDLRLGILFGQDNERGIAGVHRGILEHQFLRAGEILGPRAQKLDGSFADQGEQGVNGLGVTSQIPTGFAKHNLACVDRAFDFFKNGDTPLVPLVGGIEPTDQRTGINDCMDFLSPRAWRDPKDR